MNDDYLDLLDWLQERSRAYGWGGLLAWDRNKVNSLLLQTYNASFDSDRYLPTFTDLIVTSTRTAEYIYDYTLDCPRLTFDNATIRDPRAHLRMQVIGGLQLTLEYVSGDSSRILQIAAMDVLDGRSLYMKLALAQIPGTTGSAGQVALDLAKGGDFDLTFAPSEQERWLGGEYFRKQFELLDDKKKVFILGELELPDGQLLKPADFEISTHGKPGDPERGAVLFFIRMEGEEYGSLPPTDNDLRFLLEGGYSFFMLLSRDFMMQHLFIPACKALVRTGRAFAGTTEHPPGSRVHYLRATAGTLEPFSVWKSTPSFESIEIANNEVPLKAERCSFELQFNAADIYLHWIGHYVLPVKLTARNGQRATVDCKIWFEFKRAYRFNLRKVEGLVEILPVSSGTLDNCQYRISEDGSIPDAVQNFYLEASGPLEQQFMDLAAHPAIERFRQALAAIPLDQMTRMLFQQRDDVVFEKFSFSPDLTLFGHITPPSLTFATRPLELVTGPGDSQLFTTWPPRLVQWRVDNLPGQTGPTGRINSLGVYTAPTADQLTEPFKRVKVSAVADGYSSTALVTLLPSDITVNPLVMVHTAGKLDDGREMHAGTRGAGTLRWALADGHSGGRIVPSGAADGDHTYFPGPRNPDLVFSIDEVQVTNLATLRMQTAHVLLLHQDLVLTVTATRGSGDTLQLRAFLQGDEMPDLDREWQVLLGGGSVDRQSGVFTPGASAHRFAIVTVKMYVVEDFAFEGFILLPLPYIEIPPWDPEQVAALRGPAPKRG